MSNVTTIVDRGVREPAQLTNMRLGISTMLELQDAPEGSPRLGLFYGPSGYGKSVAAATIAARMDAAYVVARSVWTATTLLQAIAREIGIIAPRRNRADLLDQINQQFLREPQPLIIDEMDCLVKSDKTIEVIRDIHEGGAIPILMIGEEALPAKLARPDLEKFDNRILVKTPAQPSSLADAKLLRDYYCTRVNVADDLVEAILHAHRGRTRRIVVDLQRAQSAAINGGEAFIDLRAWGDRRFATGDVAIRKVA